MVVCPFIKEWIAFGYIAIMELFCTNRCQNGNNSLVTHHTKICHALRFTRMRVHVAIIIILALFGCTTAHAFEPVPITLSNTMNNIIFDGKWTFEFEWKASSLNTYDYDNETQIILRSAHQGDFVYVFLDAVTDYHPANMKDYAIICFDTQNNKSMNSDSNDYCFKTYLNGDSTTYQGGNNSNETNFNKISNPEGFISISSISDVNDRYTATPHPSYEFKIPTSLIGRESVYGFYFLVYDDDLKKSYTYPQDIQVDNFVSSPIGWGEIYSPDKSLPEFSLPVMSLVLSFGLVAFLTRLKGINLQK